MVYRFSGFYKGISKSFSSLTSYFNKLPWKFIEVRGEARKRLGNTFVETAKSINQELSDAEIEKLLKAPLRAPMVIILAADVKHHPKVPEIEQIISLEILFVLFQVP